MSMWRAKQIKIYINNLHDFSVYRYLFLKCEFSRLEFSIGLPHLKNAERIRSILSSKLQLWQKPRHVTGDTVREFA